MAKIKVNIERDLYEIAQKNNVDIVKAVCKALDDSQLFKIFSKTKINEHA